MLSRSATIVATEAPSRGVEAALTLAVALIALLPLLVVSIPPLHDYPFHLARADAIATLLGQTDEATHYELGSFLLPNVGMDVVTLGLTAFLPPVLAGRVFLCLVQVSLLSGTVALHRALHKRFSPWPLLAAFILYNWMFLYGFTNYLFGVGIMLWAVALWLTQGAARPLARLTSGSVLAVAIMFCHLVAFGLLAVILGGIALSETFAIWRRSRRIAFGVLLAPALPLGVGLAVFVALSPTAGEVREPIEYANWFGWKPLMAWRSVLSSLPWLDLITIAPLVALIALVAARRGLRLAPAMLLPLALLLLTFLTMPYGLFGSLYADARLPIAIWLVGIAAVDLKPMRPAPLLAGTALALGLLLVRDAAIARQWRAEEPVIDEYRAAYDLLPPDAVLYVASAEPFPKLAYASAAELARWHPPTKHLVSLASIGHDVFVPATWADPFKQPIAVPADEQAAKRLQGDNPFQTSTEAELAAAVARIRALPTAKPTFLLLLRPTALRGVAPPGLIDVAHGSSFALFRLGP